MFKNKTVWVCLMVSIGAVFALFLSDQARAEWKVVQGLSEAFLDLNLSQESAKLSVSSFWKEEEVFIEKKQAFLQDLLEAMEIQENFSFSILESEDRKRIDLSAHGESYHLSFSVITLEENKHYLTAYVHYLDFSGIALEHKEKMDRFLEKQGIVSNSTLEWVFSSPSFMDEEERRDFSRRVMNQLSVRGKEKVEGEFFDFYTAYTPKIARYLLINGRRKNLSLVLSFDEERNQTIIYGGIPFISKGF